MKVIKEFRIIIVFALAISPFLSYGQNYNPLPNLVIIFTDDLGYGDLGCYGHPTIHTPHLDQMAEEGMKFTQFYSASSVCTPSRAALLTGRYPIRTGLVEGIIPGRVLFPNDETGLPHEEVTIAELLKQKNYATLAVGKWHLGHLPEYLPMSHGFDSFYGVPYSNDMDHVSPKDGQPAYKNVPLMRNDSIIERPANQHTLTKRYTEEAVKFINENTGNPFFLYLAHTMPHIPLFVSRAFEGTSRRGLYGDVIEELDWSVGEIVKTLKQNGIEKNTLVIFTSDNGPWLVQGLEGGSSGLLREGKGTTWEGGMRVPMIAWWPGTIAPGQIQFGMTSTLDILPTVAEMARIDLPDRLIDGSSILSVLNGKQESWDDRFFCYYRGDRLFAARMGPWKAHYIVQTAYPDGPLQYQQPPLLYNLDLDPSEKYNVAADYPEVLVSIDERVQAHSSTVTTTRIPEIEAENLAEQATCTGGRIRIQTMGGFAGEWGNDAQLWWVEATPGDRLSIPIEIDQAGEYEFYGFFTRAGDYGIFKTYVNGQAVGNLVDGYNRGVEHSGPVSFGKVSLRKGINTIAIELIGKDVRSGGYSDGYLVGIDGFLFLE